MEPKKKLLQTFIYQIKHFHLWKKKGKPWIILIKILLIFFLVLTIYLTFVLGRRAEAVKRSVPLINSSQDPLTISCEYTRQDLLKGLTAYDVEDGYITDSIIPGKFAPFTEKGVSEIQYSVFDSDGNCGRYKRKVVFSDYSSPTVALSDPLVFYPRDSSNTVVKERIFGNDCFDGDVKHIRIDSSNINYAVAGDYSISISLINSFGDTVPYTLPVHIIKKTYGGLDIRLKEYLIYIKKGTNFTADDYVKEVELNQTEELIPQKDWGIKIQSNVDTSKAGVYEVSYTIKKVKDEVYGDASGITWLTVIVSD